MFTSLVAFQGDRGSDFADSRPADCALPLSDQVIFLFFFFFEDIINGIMDNRLGKVKGIWSKEMYRLGQAANR